MLAVAFLATACHDAIDGFRVGPARQTAEAVRPGADPFQAALYEGYMTLGAAQYYEGNYSFALVYYRKAIAAAQDQETRPQLVSWIAQMRPIDPRAAGGGGEGAAVGAGRDRQRDQHVGPRRVRAPGGDRGRRARAAEPARRDQPQHAVTRRSILCGRAAPRGGPSIVRPTAPGRYRG